MNYDTFNELRAAIHHLAAEQVELSQMLDDVMQDFVTHNPGLNPR
ncbi:hypothetical protein [Legionella rowbothamii]|nr:hypothetical protein [Legionella rowbothamii]